MNVDRRMARRCPSCSAPMTPWTDPFGRTRFRTACSPRRCRLAYAVALAGGARPTGFEPLPVDDAAQYHRHVPFGGNAA